jgi:hypothetical protein
MIKTPDAIIEVRFRTTDEGGRKTPVDGDFYSCPLFVDGEGFDCRIFLGNQRAELGQWYQFPVKFLRRDFVISGARQANYSLGGEGSGQRKGSGSTPWIRAIIGTKTR